MPAFSVFMVPCWLLATTQGIFLPPTLMAATVDPLAPLPADRARVFSVRPGGTVPAALPGGVGRMELSDGEIVQFLDWEQGADMNDAVATVNVRGQEIKVPNDQVATADRTYRSPDGKWAIIATTQTCDGGCRGVGWLLGKSLRARFSTYMQSGAQVAWRKDGTEVAIVSGGLYVISLPDGALTTSPESGAPSYTRSGKLMIAPVGGEAYAFSRDDHPQVALSDDEIGDGFVPDGAAGRPDPTFRPSPAMAFRAPRRRGAGAGAFAAGVPGRAGGRAPSADLAQVLMVILDEGTPVAQAARLARRQRLGNPAYAHQVGRAANTRGFRLLKTGDKRQALTMFEAAAAADPRYGMPRYSAARLYAMRGDARGAARWLKSLKKLPRGEQRRLLAARKDDAFARISGAPEMRAIFKAPFTATPRLAESSGPIVYRRARRGR
jgi:hypothetical protein